MTQIFPLSEGTFTVGRDKLFQPFEIGNDELTERTTGSLLVEVQPFAVVNDRDVILLDTGLGFNNPTGHGHLVANLNQHHIHPDEVSKVLLSHLHKDHAGGINMEMFPNATFYVYRPEFEFAQQKGMPSYFTDDLAVLAHHPRVVWLEGESGSVANYIHFEHTDGHCPHHIIFKIESEEGLIFYGGDEAPQYKQMKMKYIAKYDYDGKKAMLLRQQWAEQGAAEGWRFLFYHDIKMPVSRL